MTARRPQRTGGEIVVEALTAHGIDAVFQLPGESFIPILDALHDRSNTIRTVTARHEAAAANMAEAYGKLTGRPGVCVVTRGPGASHASVGVHIAFQDSTPMILLVGQTERPMLGREAFQEIDVPAMFGWTAKWAAQVTDTARLPEALATQTRDSPSIVRAFEEIHSQPVRRDLKLVTEARHGRKRVKATAGHQARKPIDRVESVNQPCDLVPKFLHSLIALLTIVLQGGDAGYLGERRHAGQRRVGELTQHLDRRWVADGESQPTATHAE